MKEICQQQAVLEFLNIIKNKKVKTHFYLYFDLLFLSLAKNKHLILIC